MTATCEACRYFIAGLEGRAVGLCARYPKHIQVSRTHGCGEYRKVVKRGRPPKGDDAGDVGGNAQVEGGDAT